MRINRNNHKGIFYVSVDFIERISEPAIGNFLFAKFLEQIWLVAAQR